MFGIAYRMLGSGSDAEDIVQQAYLRWHSADKDGIRRPSAWLAKVVTNLALSHVDSARVRRERYVGAWLPEPLLTSNRMNDPADSVEMNESLTFGMLILLDRLTPQERAVFVLREALAYSHRDIADAIQITEEHARQLLHRARRRVQEAGQNRLRHPHHGERLVAKQFLEALRRADADELQRLLAPDVSSTADGGGKVNAARKTVRGRTKVLRYLLGILTHPQAAVVKQMEIAEVNGQPGLLVHSDQLIAVALPLTRGQQVEGLFIQVNPDKLTFLSRQLDAGAHSV